MKKILQIILYFIPWLLSGLLFQGNYEYYESLNLPFFALPKELFFPFWIILYLLIAISITIVVNNTSKEDRKSYRKALLSNYVFNQLFVFCFFTLQNKFLGFLDTVAVMITSLFLYYETKELNSTASKFLLPYVFYVLYALILSISIYFMNL